MIIASLFFQVFFLFGGKKPIDETGKEKIKKFLRVSLYMTKKEKKRVETRRTAEAKKRKNGTLANSNLPNYKIQRRFLEWAEGKRGDSELYYNELIAALWTRSKMETLTNDRSKTYQAYNDLSLISLLTPSWKPGSLNSVVAGTDSLKEVDCSGRVAISVTGKNVLEDSYFIPSNMSGEGGMQFNVVNEPPEDAQVLPVPKIEKKSYVKKKPSDAVKKKKYNLRRNKNRNQKNNGADISNRSNLNDEVSISYNNNYLSPAFHVNLPFSNSNASLMELFSDETDDTSMYPYPSADDYFETYSS